MVRIIRTPAWIAALLGALWLQVAQAGAPSPSEAYHAYLDAIVRADTLEALYPHWTVNHVNEVREEIKRAGRIGRNAAEDLNTVLKQIKKRAAMTDRDSVRTETSGGRATLRYKARDPENDKRYRVVVDMLFEDGAWKVLRERMFFDKKP